MTENEYTNEQLIDFMYDVMDWNDAEDEPIIYEIIEALKEREQYRAIGTIEKFKALKEPQKEVWKSNFSIEQYKSDTDTAWQCGYNKALKDFAERLKDLIAKNVEDAESSDDLCCEIYQSEIDEMAEEMRGAING